MAPPRPPGERIASRAACRFSGSTIGTVLKPPSETTKHWTTGGSCLGFGMSGGTPLLTSQCAHRHSEAGNGHPSWHAERMHSSRLSALPGEHVFRLAQICALLVHEQPFASKDDTTRRSRRRSSDHRPGHQSGQGRLGSGAGDKADVGFIPGALSGAESLASARCPSSGSRPLGLRLVVQARCG